MTNTYTLGSEDGHAAMLAALPDHYEMALNRSDMRTVLDALKHAVDTLNDPDEDARFDYLYGSIAETLGIELI